MKQINERMREGGGKGEQEILHSLTSPRREGEARGPSMQMEGFTMVQYKRLGWRGDAQRLNF